jgi:hypothetical protein
MRNIKGLQKLTLAAVLLSGLYGGQIFAATSGTTTATLGVQGGSLSITAPAVTTDFGNITLTTGSQVANASIGTLSVVDATGSGAGYKVMVQASQFTEVTPGGGWAGGTSAKTLPLSSLKLGVPSSVTAVGGTTSPAPAVQIGAATVIDSGSQVKLLSAAVGNGMGSYDVAFAANALGLTVDVATAQVDPTNYSGVPTPYASTITWSIVTGP